LWGLPAGGDTEKEKQPTWGTGTLERSLSVKKADYTERKPRMKAKGDPQKRNYKKERYARKGGAYGVGRVQKGKNKIPKTVSDSVP